MFQMSNGNLHFAGAQQEGTMASTLVLSNASLLQQVIGYIGPGEFVFIAT
jgi:hypothetical protein